MLPGDRRHDRAERCAGSSGGIEYAKAVANYAPSLRASSAAVARGCAVALWLDAREHRYIQGLFGMNIFAVIVGELHTPELDSAILAGITRDSLITLARSHGYQVRERPMPLDELLEQIQSGACSELFVCGTAAIVSPISVLSDSDDVEHKPVKSNAVARELRDSLLAIQERRAPDPFGWAVDVERFSSPPVRSVASVT